MAWIVTTDENGKPKLKSEEDLRRERNASSKSPVIDTDSNNSNNILEDDIFDSSWNPFFTEEEE